MAPGATVLRYAAFTTDPAGGNPAGVVLDAAGLHAARMQQIAAEVGYSETAFVTGAGGGGELHVRYFSPLAEVPFCGHATIATGVAWAEANGPGALRLHTPAGLVHVDVQVRDGTPIAALTSVAPRTAELSRADLAEILTALRWRAGDLDGALPPRVAFAGAWHPVLAARSAERLARLDYDFERLGRLMAERGWTTVQLVHRTGADTFRARNPFPPGGVIEDPATGAAAAALGGYLRELGLVTPPATLTVSQGEEMGRPGVLVVDVPEGDATGIRVSGAAVPIAP